MSSGSDLSGLRLFVPEGSSVLINVPGEIINISGGSMEIDEPENVLVNFYEATSISLQSFGVEGSVLAPQADLTFSGGSINGKAIIGGDVIQNNGAEFHSICYMGNVTCDVCELVTITVQPISETCEGGGGEFCVDASGSNLSYQWEYSWNGLTSNGNAGEPGNTTSCLTNVPTVGAWFRVRVMSDGGCVTYSDWLQLNVVPNPEANVTNNGPITCAQPNAVLTASPSGMSYLWEDGSTGETRTVSASGTYAVTVTM